MKSRRLTLIVVALLGGFVLADVASAQLFRRVWERRKSELRSELSYQLNAKMQASLEREVEEVQAQLMAAAKEAIAQEGAKLTAQVESEIANMRKQAAAIIAKESQRLSAQTAKHVEQLRAAAKQQVVAESAKLEKQVAAAMKSLNRQFAAGKSDLAKVLDGRLGKIPSLVTTEVNKQLPSQVAKHMAENKPKDEEKKTSVPLKDIKAIESKKVELQEEKTDSDE